MNTTVTNVTAVTSKSRIALTVALELPARCTRADDAVGSPSAERGYEQTEAELRSANHPWIADAVSDAAFKPF